MAENLDPVSETSQSKMVCHVRKHVHTCTMCTHSTNSEFTMENLILCKQIEQNVHQGFI